MSSSQHIDSATVSRVDNQYILVHPTTMNHPGRDKMTQMFKCHALDQRGRVELEPLQERVGSDGHPLRITAQFVPAPHGGAYLVFDNDLATQAALQGTPHKCGETYLTRLFNPLQPNQDSYDREFTQEIARRTGRSLSSSSSSSSYQPSRPNYDPETGEGPLTSNDMDDLMLNQALDDLMINQALDDLMLDQALDDVASGSVSSSSSSSSSVIS